MFPVLFRYPYSCSRMEEMHSKRPKFSKFSPKNLAPSAQAVHSPPIPKILPPTQIPIENPEVPPPMDIFWNHTLVLIQRLGLG